jgi:hypothetical protein
MSVLGYDGARNGTIQLDGNGYAFARYTTDATGGTTSLIHCYIQNTCSVEYLEIQMAIYSDDAANNIPETQLAAPVTTTMPGSATGEKSESYVVDLAPNTSYWLVLMAADAVGAGYISLKDKYDAGTGDSGYVGEYSSFVLPDPWPHTGSSPYTFKPSLWVDYAPAFVNVTVTPDSLTGLGELFGSPTTSEGVTVEQHVVLGTRAALYEPDVLHNAALIAMDCLSGVTQLLDLVFPNVVVVMDSLSGVAQLFGELVGTGITLQPADPFEANASLFNPTVGAGTTVLADLLAGKADPFSPTVIAGVVVDVTVAAGLLEGIGKLFSPVAGRTTPSVVYTVFTPISRETTINTPVSRERTIRTPLPRRS